MERKKEAGTAASKTATHTPDENGTLPSASLLPAIAPEDLWEETYPDHVSGAAVGTAGYGIVEFSYDPAGRIRMKTDQQGDTCTFTYNLAGQLLSRAYRTAANSPSGTVADSDTFTYDRAGRMLTALSGRYANTVTLAYDHAGRLASEGLTIAGQTYSVGRTYDVRGLEATLSYPGGGVVQRSYTPRRQLQQTSYLGAVVESRTYDAAGRHATSTYGNAAVTTNSYRLDNLLASRATSHAGSEQLGTYSYSWDANKNKTAETIGAQGSGFGFSVPAGGYDQEDRLTAWNRTDGARNQSWTLSAVGDWTAHSDAGVSQTRTHAAAHELTALTTGGTTSPLSYDPKGNLLSRPAALASPALGLVWDFDNRLRGADTNGTPATQEVTFEYDALGRRVARSEAGNNVVYVHAGQQVIADYARGAAAAAPSFRYVYGTYVDEPLLRHAGTGTTLPTSGTAALYYHRNQQYSIVALSDAAGTLVERYAYTAYGELTILAPDRTARATSSFQNRYTYTGREWDPTLHLYYFRARWLEPKAGRFIGRDPLGYVDGMGLYGAYFAVRGVDPMGLKGGHHWFPQSPRLQALLGKKCPLIPSILDFIHLFTTPMKGWGKGTLHDAIHHELKDGSYLGQVEKVYKNSKTCCELLKQMKDLILRVWLEANAIVYKGPWPMPSPGMPSLMPYDDDPWNTWQYLDEVIDVICNPKRRPRGEPDCLPLPVPDPKRYPESKPLFEPKPKLPWMEPTWMEPNGGYRQPPNYFPLPPLEWPGIPGPELTPEQKIACKVIIILAGGRLVLRFLCPPTNLVPPVPGIG